MAPWLFLITHRVLGLGDQLRLEIDLSRRRSFRLAHGFDLRVD